jgi:acetyltransferase-like isoleucine patch superfamily enzyme
MVEPGSIYGGAPAKFIKKIDPEQSKEINQKIARNYLMYSGWYK